MCAEGGAGECSRRPSLNTYHTLHECHDLSIRHARQQTLSWSAQAGGLRDIAAMHSEREEVTELIVVCSLCQIERWPLHSARISSRRGEKVTPGFPVVDVVRLRSEQKINAVLVEDDNWSSLIPVRIIKLIMRVVDGGTTKLIGSF